MNNRGIQNVIDKTVKNIWLRNIKTEYEQYALLKEDTFKNELYRCIKNELGNNIFSQYGIRIYTEYEYCGKKADLAIVKMKDVIDTSKHIKENIEDVLAIFELKFKNGGYNEKHFMEDVQKIKYYRSHSINRDCQYYLGFIDENVYENDTNLSWLEEEDKEWASGFVTELSAFYLDEPGNMVWHIISYNK